MTRYDELKVLQRHAPDHSVVPLACSGPHTISEADWYRADWPCVEVVGVAERLGIEVTDG